MRPAIYKPEQIIEIELAIRAEQWCDTEFAQCKQVGSSPLTNLRLIWEEDQVFQTTVITVPFAKLPMGVAEALKRHDLSRMVKLSVNKKTGGQNA